jgi:hypothetical protein
MEVRRKFAGYGWYDGTIMTIHLGGGGGGGSGRGGGRSGGGSSSQSVRECAGAWEVCHCGRVDVVWEDGSMAVMTQQDAAKFKKG